MMRKGVENPQNFSTSKDAESLIFRIQTLKDDFPNRSVHDRLFTVRGKRFEDASFKWISL